MSNSLIDNLPKLQNLIKRTPDVFRDDYDQMYLHFTSNLELFKVNPSQYSEDFVSLVQFLSHVTPCYKDKVEEFKDLLVSLLNEYYNILHFDVRKSLVQSLILLRNKNCIDILPLMEMYFKLLRVQDKNIRIMVYSHVVNDIVNSNKNKKNERYNNSAQNVLFRILYDTNQNSAKLSLKIVTTLYRKQIWNDSKTVNAIALACLSKNESVVIGALNFFLGIEDLMEEDKKEKEEQEEKIEVDYHKHSKKTKKKQTVIKRQLANIKKRKLAKNKIPEPLFPAIEMVNDPQGFVEKLYDKLQRTIDKFELKLLYINCISQFIGRHKLILLPFYSYIQRYIKPHQLNVPQILAYLVQTCHSLIPPEEIIPSVLTIANNFIGEKCLPEIISLGINSLREICTRIPLVLEEDRINPLINEIIAMKSYKNKAVVIAARSFLNMVRRVDPNVLNKSDRCRGLNLEVRPAQFGEVVVHTGVDGAELLDEVVSDEEKAWNVKIKEHGSSGSEDEEDSLNEDNEDNEVNEGSDGDNDDDDQEGFEFIDDNEGIEIDDNEEGEENDEYEEGEEETDEMEGPAENSNNKNKDNDGKSQCNSKRIDQIRILTPLDFQKINELKRKRPQQSGIVEGQDSSERIDPSDLIGYRKKRKLTYEERLDAVKEGRTKFEPKKQGGGSTNKEKQRKKNFMMMKHSRQVRDKLKQSIKTRQKRLEKEIKSYRLVGKKMHKRRRF